MQIRSGQSKTTGQDQKAAEPIALHRLKKLSDVDNLEELNGFQQDLIYLLKALKK